VYSDPDTKRPFYIGVGQRTSGRAFSHMDKPTPKDEKGQYLLKLDKQGKKPIIEVLIYGVSRSIAEGVEAAAIDLIGINNLTNKQKGRGANEHGKINAELLEAMLKGGKFPHADLKKPALLLCMNTRYRRGMSAFELYEAARCGWNISREVAEGCQYIMPVFDGKVLDVYMDARWFEAGTCMRMLENIPSDTGLKGLEFVAKRTSSQVFNKFVGKIIGRKFSKTQFLVLDPKK